MLKLWKLLTLWACLHEKDQKKYLEVKGQPGEKGITETQVEVGE